MQSIKTLNNTAFSLLCYCTCCRNNVDMSSLMRAGGIWKKTWGGGVLKQKGVKVSRNMTEYMCVNESEASGTIKV